MLIEFNQEYFDNNSMLASHYLLSLTGSVSHIFEGKPTTITTNSNIQHYTFHNLSDIDTLSIKADYGYSFNFQGIRK